MTLEDTIWENSLFINTFKNKFGESTEYGHCTLTCLIFPWKAYKVVSSSEISKRGLTLGRRGQFGESYKKYSDPQRKIDST